MRVTQNMTTRNYLRNMNRNIYNLNKSVEKMTSGKKFQKGSENVSDAAKALRLRQSLNDDEQYLENIRDANGWLSAAESNLSSINEIIVTAREKLTLKSLNDATGAQRETMAAEIDKLKDQIVQFANAQFSEKYIFGGTNNGQPPFKMGDDGRLQYNGAPVDDVYLDPADGKYYYDAVDPNGGNPIKTRVPESEEVFMDVGLGITMTGNSIDSRSAFKMSFNGLEVLGFGKTADGVSNNLVNMLTDASVALRAEPFDRTTVEGVCENLKVQREKLMLNVLDVGTRTQFLDKTEERLESDIFNIKSLQQKVEVIDDPTEAMNWKMYSAVLMATYQFGSEVLPTSLMDFLK